MSLAQVFLISLYSLTVLAAGTLAYAEEMLYPAAVTIPLALLAFFFNERWRVLWVSPVWTNLFGIAAALLAATKLLNDNVEGPRAAGTHFLVYLTWIVLLQRKGIRQYWWLLCLGLLQVSVAAILTLSPTFGLLLLAYLALAVWTLAVFSLYRAALTFGVEELPFEASKPAPASSSSASAEDSRADNTAAAGQGNLGRTGQRVWNAASVVVNSVQHDPRENWINLRFVRGVVGVIAGGLLLAMVFFLFVPRMWYGSLTNLGSSSEASSLWSRRLTGFSHEVRLGEMGEILESHERVLQYRLVDNDTGKAIDPYVFARHWGHPEPLLRGTVLDTYERGSWSSRGWRRRQVVLSAYTEPGMIRQDIRLEPIGTDILFALRPFHSGEIPGIPGALTSNSGNGVLSWSQRATELIEYKIYSFPPSDKSFSPTDFESEQRHFNDVVSLTGAQQLFKFRDLQLPAAGLERLTILANELTQAEELLGTDDDSPELRKALTLLAYLRNEEQFRYSLSARVHDPTIDPVEDFLFNRREGHCEYYAAALALMLRSVGVNARVVGGFKGGVYNALTGYYEIYQRHAHAWVEAFVDSDWIVLDATPADPNATEGATTQLGFWAYTRSLLSSFWRENVLSFSFQRQKEKLFNPLLKTATSGRMVETVKQSAQTAIGWIRYLSDKPDRWISWRGGVTAFVLLVLLSGIGWAVGRGVLLVRLLSQQGRDATGRSLVRVEFYERFLTLMQSAGLRRQSSQTQHEFADEVEQLLASRLGPAGLAGIPRELSDLFYRVRFGNGSLNADDARRVHEQLQQLQHCLENSANTVRS